MSRQVAGAGNLEYALGATGGVTNAGFYGTQIFGGKITTTSDATWQSFMECEGVTINDTRIGTGRRNDGNVYYANHAGLESTPALAVEDSIGHFVLFNTKATGTNAVTRHLCVVGGSRTSVATTATFADSASIANGRIQLGGDQDPMTGLIWLGGLIPGVVFSTTQIDAIMTARTTASIYALGNANSWLVDEADEMATDYFGNHDRTAVNGTVTTSADNPPGWVFGLGGAPTTSFPPVQPFRVASSLYRR